MLELSKDKVTMIVAYSRNTLLIGKNGDLPWGKILTGDLKFIDHLMLHPDVGVIMGRKTFESLKQALPRCVNIVISSKPLDNAIVVRSYDEAIAYCRKNNLKIVNFGGTRVYEETFKRGNYVLIATIVDYDGDGDTVFPKNDTPLKCVDKEVYDIIGKGNWSFSDDGFSECGMRYNFYVGEK